MGDEESDKILAFPTTVVDIDGWKLNVRSKDANPKMWESMLIHKCLDIEDRMTNAIYGAVPCSKCHDCMPDEIYAVWMLQNWEKM